MGLCLVPFAGCALHATSVLSGDLAWGGDPMARPTVMVPGVSGPCTVRRRLERRVPGPSSAVLRLISFAEGQPTDAAPGERRVIVAAPRHDRSLACTSGRAPGPGVGQ